MGPYNYPLNETFATLIPALHHGQHGGVQAAAVRRRCCSIRCSRRSAAPSRKASINTVYGTGGRVVPRAAGFGQGQRADADRLEQGRRPSEEAASEVAPAARHPRPRREERRHRLPDADIELAVKECLLGALSFNGQRCTALKMLIVHRSIVDRFCSASPRNSASSRSACRGRRASASRRCRTGKAAYMTECIDDAKAQGRAGRQRGRRRVLQDAVLSGRRLSGARGHEALSRGAVRADRPGDAVRRRREPRSNTSSRPTTASRSASSAPIRSRSARWSIRSSTRSAASTSIASASAGRTCSRSPGARIRPRARCR